MAQRRPSYEDAIRMVTMLRMLEQRATKTMPRRELAERLEASTRTIDRYVAALAQTISTDQGEPILCKESRDGEICVRLAREAPPIATGIYQYAAVWAATRFLKAGKGSLLSDTADELLQRLGDGEKPRPRLLLDRLATAFCYVPFGPKDYRANDEVLDPLVQATLWQHPLVVERESRDGARVEERLEPLTIVMYRDGLYLLARKVSGAGEEEQRLYAVERMLAARIIRDERFELPQGFDPGRRFAGRLGLWEPRDLPVTVEIAFTPEAAEVAAKRLWPGFKGWRKADDGRELLELEIPLSPEVRTWVMSWGTQAEVLRPKALREMVIAELRGALSRYEE
jgi:predicted DNA-binding transcriptional regulator YafY